MHRYGTVLKTLSEETLAETEPFAGMLVNARYVRNASAREVVVIDSEGLDLHSQRLARDFPLSLQLLDLFFRLSDHVVFLLRAGGLSDAVASVQCLDLLLGYSALGPGRQSQYLGRLLPLLSAGASSLVRATVPGGHIVAPALQLLLNFVGGENAESAKASGSSADQQVALTAAGGKLSFAISQMDVCVDRADEQAQIFALGMLLGRHLHKVARPHGDALFPISIPAPHRRCYADNALDSLLAAVFGPSVVQPKRMLREQELRSRLRQCAQRAQQDLWVRVKMHLRQFFCGLEPIPALLSRSHIRQTYFSQIFPSNPTHHSNSNPSDDTPIKIQSKL